MMMSKQTLIQKAKSNDFKPEILEKVYFLLATLDHFFAVPYLRERLVLKGGTALNIFYFKEKPRLSVDIDLNYIGQHSRDQMLQERPIIKDAIYQIFHKNQFELDRNPTHHAGGKMVWRYPSALGQKGNLEVDLSFMYRQPLWPTSWLESNLYYEKSVKIPVLNIHELAAGKLSALFSRRVSRDLFDAHYLLTKCDLTLPKLRLAFTVYLAMTDIQLSNLKPEYINYNIIDMRNRLFPVMRQKNLPRLEREIETWANKLLNELRQALSAIIPLKNKEIEFIKKIRTTGEIQSELITDDETLISIIKFHPAIQWAIAKSKSRVTL